MCRPQDACPRPRGRGTAGKPCAWNEARYSSSYFTLEKALAPALDGAATVVVFDLAGLDFISSAGLRVLMAARKRLSARKGKLLLKNPRPHVQKVFEIVKALPDVKIFASVQELDEYLASIQAHG